MRKIVFEFVSMAGMLAVLVALGAAPLLATLSDCHEATCRISAADGGRGTGCAFERSGGIVYVLTNAHVATGATVNVEFWREGHKSNPLTGRVIARDEKADAAVVAIAESQFAGLVPKIIPLGEKNSSPRPGRSIMSVGCADGSWSTGWKGHVLGYSGADMYFLPPPANGRSGSAIFDAEGKTIVGLLKARLADDSAGIASSLPSLHQAFTGRNRTLETSIVEKAASEVQCPGGSCPNPSPSPWRLSPYRHFQDERLEQLQQQQPQQVWPTFPGNTSPQINLDSTNQKLDRIADLLMELRIEKRAEPVPLAPLVPIPAPKTVDVAGEQAIAESRQAVVEVEQEVRQVSDKLREVVNTLIGDRETLRERFDERLEKVKSELGDDAQRRDIARAYAKDFVQEKLADGTLGLSGGKLVAGALGLSGPLSLAIGIGLWMLSRRAGAKLDAGDPLLVQRLIERVTDKVDGLKDRLVDQQADINSERKAAT